MSVPPRRSGHASNVVLWHRASGGIVPLANPIPLRRYGDADTFGERGRHCFRLPGGWSSSTARPACAIRRWRAGREGERLRGLSAASAVQSGE